MWCITIVGIPFGRQFFKMARLSFMPFGASVIGENTNIESIILRLITNMYS
ncbi:MAG: YccF domain-containing protein [Lachnospiraceae bacterium]